MNAGPQVAAHPTDRVPFQIYEDVSGEHFVLLKQQIPGVWQALKPRPVPRRVLLSEFNLNRLHLIGVAGFVP